MSGVIDEADPPEGGSGTHRAVARHLLLLVGDGFGEECDDLSDNRLRLRRAKAAEATRILHESPEDVRGLVVRQNGSPESCLEPLAALRRLNRHLISAAVVHEDDRETRRQALRLRARCISHETGVDATWRAVRYASVLGAKDPIRRRTRVELFGQRYGLTPTELEYIDLLDREIPYADMEHVFGVKLSTKNFHFSQLRERVGVKRREELTWLFYNMEIHD